MNEFTDQVIQFMDDLYTYLATGNRPAPLTGAVSANLIVHEHRTLRPIQSHHGADAALARLSEVTALWFDLSCQLQAVFTQNEHVVVQGLASAVSRLSGAEFSLHHLVVARRGTDGRIAELWIDLEIPSLHGLSSEHTEVQAQPAVSGRDLS